MFTKDFRIRSQFLPRIMRGCFLLFVFCSLSARAEVGSGILNQPEHQVFESEQDDTCTQGSLSVAMSKSCRPAPNQMRRIPSAQELSDLREDLQQGRAGLQKRAQPSQHTRQ